MCFRCPPLSADPAEDITDCHEDLKEFEAAFGRTLHLANQIEDEYRQAGMNYHSTQIEARRSSSFPRYYLHKLKETFEIIRVEEYLVIFARLHNIFKALCDLRSMHLRYSGTPEQLIHRVYGILEPGFDNLNDQLHVYRAELSGRLKDADILFDMSREVYESDGQGRRCAWQDASGADVNHRPVPRRMGEEWEKYRAWVWSLPETQRGVVAGRTVDDIALELLYYEPEGFIA
jgi:hypothetical protein